MSDRTPLERIRAGDVPGMVRWYDPRLLTRIGIRTIISSVFGQYADQRLLQAATDQTPAETLCTRYDYSDPFSSDPNRRIGLDGAGALWIDYMADTADGFESTYTMAYLLADTGLDVEGAGLLRHGEILILGGDQCYPQATREEYKQRLLTPFGWAYNPRVAERKLFAIPGNHDWYDGLNAFDSLFCAARDSLSSGQGNRIGGWQCQQHRSYWAIKLPYRWWVWGTDIQFSSYLDIAQVNYFETVAKTMGPEDNLIICIAEPSWMIAEMQGEDEEQNFFKITAIARKHGIRICAVVAGDWHHYSRYYAPELGVHFITAGGGGAFMHPTHVLRNEITVAWPKPAAATEATTDVNLPGGVQGDWAVERYDMRLRRREGRRSAVRERVGEVLEPITGPAVGAADPRRTAKCYPDKSTSWWLSLKNLAFPLYNFPFAVGIGILYWLISWQFHTVVKQHDIASGKIDVVAFDQIPGLLALMPLYVLQATLSPGFVVMLGGLFVGLVAYVHAVDRPFWRRALVKLSVGSAHFLVHAFAIFSLFLVFMATNNWIAPHAEKLAGSLLVKAAESREGVVKRVLKEALEPLSTSRSEQKDILDKEERRQKDAVPGEIKTEPAGPLKELQPVTQAQRTVAQKPVREVVGLLYPIQMSLIGGLVGGFIWGCYWVLTGLIGRMHAEDAFGALRIKDYKNFLRLKIEPDRLTIYPVGVDRVARARDLEAAGAPPPAHNPVLVPSQPIRTRLIEQPIVIPARESG